MLRGRTGTNTQSKAKPKSRASSSTPKAKSRASSSTPQSKQAEKSKQQDPEQGSSDAAAQAEGNSAVIEGKGVLTKLVAATGGIIWTKALTLKDIGEYIKEGLSHSSTLGQLACHDGTDQTEVMNLVSNLEKETVRLQSVKNLIETMRKNNIAAKVLTPVFKTDMIQAAQYFDVDTLIDMLKFLCNKLHDSSVPDLVKFTNMNESPQTDIAINFGDIGQAMHHPNPVLWQRPFLHTQREFVNKYFDTLRTARGQSEITDVFHTGIFDLKIFRHCLSHNHIATRMPSIYSTCCSVLASA